MKFFFFLLLIFSPLLPAQDVAEKKAEVDKEKNEDDPEKKEDDKPDKPLKLGNLALPTSQQPNPLISLGQNVLNKNQGQWILLAQKFQGKKQYFINLVPALLYGIRDDLSIFFNVPSTPRYKQRSNHSSGIEDIFAQLEYVFYSKSEYTYVDQGTIVANVSFPTGSIKKTPATGAGSNSFLLGATYARTGIEWYYFVSSGFLLNTSRHRYKEGDQFLYQFGLGRNIANIYHWLFFWMLEFDGVYVWRNKVQGSLDPNSGGNLFFITPSLWISNEKFFLQLGVGFPAWQNLNGHQLKLHNVFSLNTGLTF